MVAVVIDIVRTNPNILSSDVIDESFTGARMELPIAPGLGLYLFELLFDKYNRNVIRENNILIRNSEKKRKLEVNNTVTTCSSDNSNDAKRRKVDDVETEDPNQTKTKTVSHVTVPAVDTNDLGLNETLDWYNKPELTSVLHAFKENIIWSHIFNVEKRNIEFLQYLYLITYIAPKDYRIV